MKIKDLKLKDMKPEFKRDVYLYDSAIEALDLNIFSDNHTALELLTSYELGSWHCTDTTVGYKAYFFKNDFVAYSAQFGRKDNIHFFWKSNEAYDEVIKYLKSFDETRDDIELLDDTDVLDAYQIQYNGQLYPYHFDIPLYKGVPVTIIELEKKSQLYIDERVKIKSKVDESEQWIELEELDFPFNLNSIDIN